MYNQVCIKLICLPSTHSWCGGLPPGGGDGGDPLTGRGSAGSSSGEKEENEGKLSIPVQSLCRGQCT